MRALLQRAPRFTVVDYATLAESLTVAVCVEVALRLISFSRLRSWVEGMCRFTPADPLGETPMAGERQARLARFTAAAYRILPLPVTCLRESLVLCVLLRRRGVRAGLCFGVRMEGSTLMAHAWVECEGVADEQIRATFHELHALTS